MQTYKNCFKERQFQLVEKNPTCTAPVPWWGPRQPPDPPPSVGAFGPQCSLLSYILLLLQIFLTTLTHLKLESLCYCLMQLLCIYSTANAVVLTFCYIWDMVCNFFSKNLFSLKNNTCDFKSNLHCMLIWFLNHAYSFMISDQITLDTQLTFHYIWFCS